MSLNIIDSALILNIFDLAVRRKLVDVGSEIIFDSRKVNEDPFTETFHLHNTFKRILGLENLSPRFVTQKQGTEVHYHVDGFTTCAINFLVKGKQTPISFKDVGDFYYEVALLNTNHSHAVPKQVEEDRILYKLRINGMTFQEAKEKLIAAAY